MTKLPTCMIQLHHADSAQILDDIEQNSIDSCVTDPPAWIEFMGRKWDKPEELTKFKKIMGMVLYALKPGAHAFVWALPRTSHWTTTALEEAGFEIRDKVYHVQSQGFPKSQDISKAIDKTLGKEPVVVGHVHDNRTSPRMGKNTYKGMEPCHEVPVTEPATPEGEQWDGWKTGLKPAVEEWVLVRKPISETTIAKNVIRWGVGGLNIEACRVGSDKVLVNSYASKDTYKFFREYRPLEDYGSKTVNGRHPANLVTSGELDDMPMWARFFYCPKVGKKERGDSQHPCMKPVELMRHLVRLITPPGGTVLDSYMGSGSTGMACVLEAFKFIGIEKEADFFAIAQARIGGVEKVVA